MTHPADRKYTKDHEWIQVDGDVGTVGVTQHAQEALGDVVFVELPAVGRTLKQEEQLGTIESVKAVSELFSPVSGSVIAVNPALDGAPETVNADPHGAGWMIRLKLSDPSEVEGLLDASAYAKLLEA